MVKEKDTEAKKLAGALQDCEDSDMFDFLDLVNEKISDDVKL